MLNISEVGIEYENSMVRGKYNKSDGMVTHLNTLAVLICFSWELVVILIYNIIHVWKFTCVMVIYQ